MASFGMTSLGNAITGNATKAQLTFCHCTKMTCSINDKVCDIYGISKKDAEESQLWNVMINPSSIYESYGIGYEMTPSLDSSKNEVKKSRQPGTRTMSMDLIFDLVDTYELAYNKFSTAGAINLGMSFSNGPDKDTYRNSHDGKLPRQFSGYNWGSKVSEIDLHNPELTCLTKLKLAVSEGGPITLVKFEWGRFNIRGLVNDLSVRYTYFSPEGMALRAETSLRILQVPVDQADRLENYVVKPQVKDNTSVSKDPSERPYDGWEF